MISERLKPLLFRLKNPAPKIYPSLAIALAYLFRRPHPDTPKPIVIKPIKKPRLFLWPRLFLLEAVRREYGGLQIHKIFGPTAITLIEQGISLKLSRKFDTAEKLEEFVLGAAIIINGTMTKSERKEEREEWLKAKIDEFITELIYIDIGSRSVLVGPIPFEGQITIKKVTINTYKELNQVRKALYNWMKKHLKQIKPGSRPDVVDRLVRLFEEFLPNETIVFIDEQIITMLEPFGFDYKPGIVKMRKYRHLQE